MPTVPAKLKSPFKIVSMVYQRTANGDDPSVVIREAGGFQRVKQATKRVLQYYKANCAPPNTAFCAAIGVDAIIPTADELIDGALYAQKLDNAAKATTGGGRIKQKLTVLSNVFERAVNGKTVDDVLNQDGPEARDAFARAAGFYLSYYQANCKT